MLIIEEFIKNVIGWNGYFQAALVMVAGSIFTIIFNNYSTTKKLNMEKEHFEKQIERQEKHFSEQQDFQEKQLTSKIDNFKNQLRIEREKTYKELITKERLIWIGKLREDLTEYITIVNCLIGRRSKFLIEKKGNITPEENFDFYLNIEDDFNRLVKKAYAIQFRLNPKKKYLEINEVDHIKFRDDMIDLIKILKQGLRDSPDKSLEHIQTKLNEFSFQCQELLKYEWEHAKNEAKSIYQEN